MRSRALLFLALMVAALVVASGVAWAATISCPNRSGNLCVGTDNRDTMTGGTRADDMRARGGNDNLNPRGGNDKLDGGSGNDTLEEASGNDTYRFANGWGQDTLDGAGGGVDTLDFSATSKRVNVDLRQVAGSSEASSGQNFLNISNTDAIIENARGGTDRDFILGNDFTNVLVGNAGADDLWGDEGNDTLSGGAGNDSHEGVGGDDRLNGAQGNDHYHYPFAGWGNDTIIDTAVADNDLDGTFNQLFVGSAVSVSGNLTINLVSSSTSSEMHYTGLPAGFNTVEWSNNVIDRVFNLADGNDTISGNDSPNSIFSHDGNDTISAGGGDDIIDVQDGAGLDEVNCGGGIDTYKIDSGDALNLDCETEGP